MSESALRAEAPHETFQRVFSELKPRTPKPSVQVEYCRFANANSRIRMEGNTLRVRITDLLQGAPIPILEALAYILISKLYRKSAPRSYFDRYRRYLNRKEMRRTLQLVRQTRGRKFFSSPIGECYNLEEIFEDLNSRYFFGLMARPALGWSLRPSRITLGHFDPSHNAIVLSKLLDSRTIPKLAVEYVLFHEILHLKFPVLYRGTRRCVHTQEFKAAEKNFLQWKEAKELLKKL